MPEELIHLTLKEFMDSHLCRGDFLEADGSYTYKRLFDYRPINELTANQILAITGNMHTAYIQHADRYSPHLRGPVLWDYTAWTSQVDKWNRAAERSRLERIASFIKEENRRRFARAISEVAGIDYELSYNSAGKLMATEGWEEKAMRLNTQGAHFVPAIGLDEVRE